MEVAAGHGLVDHSPRSFGVPREAIPVTRHKRVGADAAGQLDRLAHVQVPDDALGLPEEVTPIHGQKRDFDRLALERGEERIGDEGVAGVIKDATVGVDEVADEAAVTVADPVSRREGMLGGNDLDGQIGDVHPVAGPDR